MKNLHAKCEDVFYTECDRKDMHKMKKVTLDDIRALVGDAIGDHELVSGMLEDKPLLGAIPELDSMAVVNLMLGLEQRFDFIVDDDEVDVDIFESLGSVKRFAQSKIS